MILFLHEVKLTIPLQEQKVLQLAGYAEILDLSSAAISPPEKSFGANLIACPKADRDLKTITISGVLVFHDGPLTFSISSNGNRISRT
jgi:hypothetical protein